MWTTSAWRSPRLASWHCSGSITSCLVPQPPRPLPLVRDYLAGFAWRYADQVTSLGVFRYIGADEVLGITAFAPGVPPEPPPWGVPALVLAGSLALGVLLRTDDGTGWCRARWLAAGAATLAYWRGCSSVRRIRMRS